MRLHRLHALCSLGLVAGFAAACGGGGESPPPADTGPQIAPDDFVAGLPTSCAFDCKKGCPDERVGPFVCPARDAWNSIPHEAVCGAAEPTTPPSTKGQCTVSPPTGEALRRAGQVDKTNVWVLPDGHRIAPAGQEVILGDAKFKGLFPVSLALVPSTPYAIVVDAGYTDHLVRTIDVGKLAAGSPDIVVSTVQLPLANWGISVQSGGDVPTGEHRVFVSGGGSGKVHVLAISDTTGALTLDDKRSIDLGTSPGTSGKANPFMAAGIAITPDGMRLVVTSVRTSDARIFSLDPASYGKQTATAALGRIEQFGAYVDPADATGEVAFVSLWGDGRVVAVDTKTGDIKQDFKVGKDPETVVALDARWLLVTSADGDSLTLVDRVAGSAVSTVPIVKDPGARKGWSPSAMTYDATAKRLYVAESVVNAIEVFDVDLSGSAPVLSSKGRIPTGWWPTDLALDTKNARLLVINARGHGTGSGLSDKPFLLGNGDIAESMKGSIQSIDLAALDLAASTKIVAQNAALAEVGGYPTVTCPAGADDFPIPKTNTEGPSKQIKHVVLVVRENKNYDGILGDMPGTEGKADLVFVPGKMDDIWTNFRGIGRTWTIADNYYTDAEYSSQGHVWTTFGRTTDFTERTWMIMAGSKGRELGGGVMGVSEVGKPEEGSVFDWLLKNNVEYDILGEGTGLPSPPTDGRRNPFDKHYPGLVQMIGLEDVTKSCYFAGRARVLCDLHDFVYMTLPNDHTLGGGSSNPTPETMCSVNDEATGVVLDALGHSPFWKDTLVIVTEDDPQDGTDHVDLHRTPIVFAGPFVKKGYVAKGHYDVASLIKLYAHIRGLPYPNEVVARAPLPLEVFTSSPDYATWTLKPRTWPRACNAAGTAYASEAESWDFDEIDEQPGLGPHVRRMFRATAEERGPLLEKSP